MKKLFTLALITFACMYQQASAQLKKGEKMLGGTVSFSTIKNEIEHAGALSSEAKQTTVNISPQLGFGLGNNWITGFNLGYAYSKYDSDPTNQRVRTKAYTAGIFARKFYPVGERFGFFGEASFAYGFGTQKNENMSNPAVKFDFNTIGAAIKPGAYFKATRRFILEATIGSLSYLRSTTENNNVPFASKSTSSDLDLSFADNLSLGIKVIL